MRPLHVLFGVCLLVACKHDHDDGTHDHSDPTSTPFPSCRAITEACHYLDVGEGPIHDCHDVGHDATSDEACAARKDACLRICTPPADGGTPDAG